LPVKGVASKGGNFLLNIGPKPDGTFPIESIERLKHIGQWMDVNGESIYGTTASPFTGLPWGRCTKRIDHDKTVLYLHVFDWPSNSHLRIPELESKIDTSYLLANHEPLETSSDEKGILIEVPKESIDPINTVIVLEVKNER
jgi:alpha-L-fucosidase